ncbi:MAG: hypothetical protein FJ403_12205 [Verrucomicrobia bacterium]|nr:hypothetical protein [Verrucomicrobiota bacterium]
MKVYFGPQRQPANYHYLRSILDNRYKARRILVAEFLQHGQWENRFLPCGVHHVTIMQNVVDATIRLFAPFATHQENPDFEIRLSSHDNARADSYISHISQNML